MTIKDYRDRVPPKSLGKEVGRHMAGAYYMYFIGLSQEFGGEYHELIAAHTTERGLSKEDIIASVTGMYVEPCH